MTNLAEAISRLFTEPWLIHPKVHAAMAHSLIGYLNRDAQVIAEDKEDGDEDDDALCIANGFAIIDVSGVLMKRPGLIERVFYGAQDIDEVKSAVSRAVALPDTHSLILNVDSPGGTVTGIPELATTISAANDAKPVFAFTDRLMASAAYWISSGTSAIFATPSAELGSVGVYMPMYDYSKLLEKMGISLEMFSTGKYKGIGVPGTSLTEDQREYLQGSVESIYGDFVEAVVAGRNRVSLDDMQGQTFGGTKAVAKGFADQLVGSIDEVITQTNPRIIR